MLFMAFAIIIFGDLLGYGNVNGEKDTDNNGHGHRVQPALKKHRQKIDLNDDGTYSSHKSHV